MLVARDFPLEHLARNVELCADVVADERLATVLRAAAVSVRGSLPTTERRLPWPRASERIARVRPMRWLPAALWPLGLAAVVTGFVLLFRGDDDVTLVAIVSRSVGGSFLFCGLIAWQRRPSNRPAC